MNKQLNVTVQYLHSYEPKCIKITFGDGILACMSRDFDIFMSKHLAGQWLLNSYRKRNFSKEKEKSRKM